MSVRAAGLGTWAAVWCLLVALQLGSAAASDRPLGSPTLLFWIVLIAASGCVLTSGALLVRAHRADSAELGLIGVYSMGVSVLPLVHGLTVPGILYGPNDATMTSVLWALPIASAAALPLLIPRRWSRVLRYWRPWVASWLLVEFTVAAALLIDTSRIPAATMGGDTERFVAVAFLLPSIGFSARHLRLYRISRRPPVLVVSLAFALIASAGLVWVNAAPMTAGFWVAHVLDIVGVLAVSIVAVLTYRRDAVERNLFRPLTIRDPLDALEFGLDPVVRAFVHDLGRKDEVTREHVKRTAETAISVGEQLGLSGGQLRSLGLGALLHDVGKLAIDGAVLKKPGRLTDAEYEQIKCHAVLGEQMVAASPVLSDIAGIIRHHHERVDGRGYPDGLSGEQIPLLARVVSACDAYDAMSHTRQYREGMSDVHVRSILSEHAGTQWDADVVHALLVSLDAGRIASQPTVLVDVGMPDSCACLAEVSFALLAS